MASARCSAITATDATAIVVDWGTSAFRAWLVNDAGTPLDGLQASCGAGRLGRDEFPAVLAGQLGPWIAAHPGIPILMSGMVGSRRGWRETRYLSAPVTLDALARHLVRVEWDHANPVYLVPGVDARDAGGAYEVMRGEETQAFGALSLLHGAAGASRTLCLPGTHSKWVDTAGGEIRGFRTHMTGEFFELLSRHSLLADSIDGSAHDAAAFAAGVAYGARPRSSLASLAFSARTRCLGGEFGRERIHAYLSGLLIGHELATEDERGSTTDGIVLIGGPALCERYADAGRLLGIASETVPADRAGLACVVALRQRLAMRP